MPGQPLVMIPWLSVKNAGSLLLEKRERGNKKIVKELVAEGCIVEVEGVSVRWLG